MSIVAERKPRYRRVKVDPFALTDHDINLIRTVAHHHLVRSTHLDQLFPERSAQWQRRRLQLLFHAGYLSRPPKQIEYFRQGGGTNPMVYCLGNKGIELLVERFGVRRSKIDWTAKARSLGHGPLAHKLEVTDFMVALDAACRARGDIDVVYFDEILRTLAPETTRSKLHPYKWPVSFPWQGKRETVHVVPDKIFALRFRGQPEGRNRKFFFLEADRGTMPVARDNLRQTSFLRKLLAYGHTYDRGLHTSTYGMRNMRLLALTTGTDRVRNLIAAHQAHTGELVSSKLFLFASRTSLFAAPDILSFGWTDGAGERRTLME